MADTPAPDETPETQPANAGETRERQVSTTDLKIIGTRPPFGDYIRGLWGRRHFIRAESEAKAFGSVKDTMLGKIWLILEPFLNAAIYYIIFALVLKFDRGVENFVAYLVIGVTFFGYLQKHLGGGVNIIPRGQNLIRAFSFPRASLVFSFVRRSFIDFIPTAIATLIFIAVIPPHAPPTWTWLLMPVALFLAVIFGTGLAFISATLTTLLSDLKFVWPLITRFWFYGSGVFWSIERFGEDSLIATVMQLNPGWVFLHLCRETLAYGNVPDLSRWLYFAGWAIVTFIIGFVLFWSQEERFGEYD